jgi:hypothetical protein
VITSRDEKKQTLTHSAVDSSNISAVIALNDLDIIKHHINEVDEFGMTPMHMAAINYIEEIYNIMIQYNPDKTIKDQEGKTYLDYFNEI